MISSVDRMRDPENEANAPINVKPAGGGEA